MKRHLTIIWLIISLLAPLQVIAGGVDNTIYKDLLNKHVKNGRVSYDGFKQDEARLDQYLAVLSAADPAMLSRNHRFAFYINAYNAFTIKLILSRYPDINSIKEIGSFFSGPWSKKFISLGGWTVSLDYIEHEVLRPKFKDPRVHFAINCAARSCPPLMGEPYEGEMLETQLDHQTRAFINNPRSTFVKDDTVFISKIFDWFEEDFNDNALFFIRQYAGERLKSDLETAGPEPKIKYLHYDWSLNRR
ncbi:MAG: DUF547 domain-containing protein [Desulfobacterales bacterium]|nr:DUF547 domain-containing protein [Desulfobacterales bacterium]